VGASFDKEFPANAILSALSGREVVLADAVREFVSTRDAPAERIRRTHKEIALGMTIEEALASSYDSLLNYGVSGFPLTTPPPW
jgi:hypothetical protein